MNHLHPPPDDFETGRLTDGAKTGPVRGGKPRVLLVDDHTLIIEGLRKVLEPEFELVGTAADGRTAIAAAATLLPDIVVLDISMPNMNGIEATRQIRNEVPTAKVVAITQYTDCTYMRAAFEAGVSGYVTKHAAVSELVIAIKQAMSGQMYVSPLLTDNKVGAVSGNPAEMFGGLLTRRQREVLQLLAEGKAAKEIANALGISVKTVEFHKAALMRELKLRTTAELTRYAVEHGIVS